MNIPNEYSINDPRLTKDFKGITISGYKRSDVTNVLNSSMVNSKIEEACRWGVEFHSTGLLVNIIKEIELVYLRNINIRNPYFLFYFYKRRNYLYKLLEYYPKKMLIFSRNNQEIRNLISELIGICTLSKKSNIFDTKSLPKLGKFAFNYKTIRNKITSKNTNRIYSYLHQQDPGEIKIALNEIANLLYNDNKTFYKIVYWYIWLKKVTQIKNKKCKIENLNFFCKEYDIQEVGTIYRNEWSWPLWKIILDYIEHKSKILNTFIRKLNFEFKKNYKGMNKKNKHYLILYTLYIVSTPINWKVKIRQHESILIQVCCNINKLYKNIETNFTNNLSLYQVKNRRSYIDNLLEDGIKKNNEKKKDMVRILNTQKGTIVDKVLLKKDKEKIKEEKNRRKLNAFYEFTSYKKNKKKNVQDYFDENKPLNIASKNIFFGFNVKQRKKLHNFSLNKINHESKIEIDLEESNNEIKDKFNPNDIYDENDKFDSTKIFDYPIAET